MSNLDQIHFDEIVSPNKQIAPIFKEVCLDNNISYSKIESFQREFFGRLNIFLSISYNPNTYNWKLSYGGNRDYFNFRINDLTIFLNLLNELKECLLNSDSSIWKESLSLSTIWTLASKEDFLFPEIFMSRMTYQLKHSGIEALSNNFVLHTFTDGSKKIKGEKLVIRDIPTRQKEEDGPQTLEFASSENPPDINHVDRLSDVLYGFTSNHEVTIYAVQMPKIDKFSILSAQNFLWHFEVKMNEFYTFVKEIAYIIRNLQRSFPELLFLIDNNNNPQELMDKCFSFISNLDRDQGFDSNLSKFFRDIFGKISINKEVVTNLKHLHFMMKDLSDLEKVQQIALKVIPTIQERGVRLKRFNSIKGGPVILPILASLALFKKLGFSTARFQLYFPLSRHLDIGEDAYEYIANKMRRNLFFCKKLIPDLNYFEQGSFIYVDLQTTNFEIPNPNKKSRVMASVLSAVNNSEIKIV